ncbi:phage tail assembly chaperone [Cohnella massiliensis]|uniref:phage tail assembly chaperone n=1 Tax=Cohnella massiliensis TaxID=1816691 RepID=UPI0009BA2A5F|nr:hypothetical protein [Cohnella massiliensis]
MSEQEEKMAPEALLASEEDILRGLIDAASDVEQETLKIEIVRKGRVLFSFRVRGLLETEYNDCKEKATTYKKNRQLGGIKMPDETDTAKYRSLLIYKATVEEDRQRVWGNKDAWKQLNVLNGPALIDKVLRAGEKDAVIAKIDELSGYGEDLEEVAKN